MAAFARNAVAALATLALAPVAGVALLAKPGWRDHLGERLGRIDPHVPGCVWVHGASVGEILAATRLLDALRAGGRPVVASTTTATGRAVLARARPDVPRCYAPLDHPWCAGAALARVAPAALVLVETELWPSWIAAATRRQVPVLVVSGRISERSLPRYRRLAPLLRGTFERLSAVGARSEADAARFAELGVATARISVTGDLKLEAPAATPAPAADLARVLSQTPYWVAASTRPGEEEAVLGAHAAARQAGLESAVVLAPRHPERIEEVARLLAARGIPWRRRSGADPAPLAAGEVLLLDTLGELPALFAGARFAFVGGTLAADRRSQRARAGVRRSRRALRPARREGARGRRAVARLWRRAQRAGYGWARGGRRCVARASRAGRRRRRSGAARAGAPPRGDRAQPRAGGARARSGRAGLTGVRRPGWFEERDAGVLRRIALAPLLPLSWLYGLGALASRRMRFPQFRPATRLSCRVVSVGNLGVGGAGKTPAAAWIASRLRARGHKVALASRGYGRRGREPVTVVSDGRFVFATADEAGDEPLLLAAHAPGVPVLVGPDRHVVGLRAIAAFGVDVLVLDDGMQHHRLERDVEIVAFDGSGLGNGHLLPRGPLREPLSALRGADAVLVVDGPLPPGDADAIEARVGDAEWFSARRRPVSIRPLAGGPATSPEGLAGHRVAILCGIARPASLRRTLEALGAMVVEQRVFPDHHRYRERDLRGLSPARLWITTEKDALKILPRWAHGADVRVLASGLEVDAGDAFVDWLERTLRAKRR